MAGNRPEGLGSIPSPPESPVESQDAREAEADRSKKEAEDDRSKKEAGADLSMNEAEADSSGNEAEDDSSGNSATAAVMSAVEDGGLPNRYVVRESDEGEYLSCREAPNIHVHVVRGMVVNGASARKYPSGTIFLDGVAQDAPFLDTERHVYNLDHHEGCVRSFTLATCEQAFILIRKGMNLSDREWTVYANDPDLDTVLAIWVLLNHRWLGNDEPDIHRRILPLLRLEGVIDVHGLEMQELTCFSPEKHKETSAQIEQLLEWEADAKRDGGWGEISFTHYTAEALRAIDAMVYSPWHFDDFKLVDEVARVEITDKHIAVICRSEAGIYEVEQQLSAIHRDRLGLIVLQKDDQNYTLRQTNLFLPVNLRRVYAHLNMVDPNAGKGSADNVWGGSADIGGSPRATGTALTASEIAEGILRAFHRPNFLQVAATAAVSLICTVIAVLLGWLATQFFDRRPEAFAATFLATATILLMVFARQYPRIYGLRLPLTKNWDWLLLLPAAALGAALGGAWPATGLIDQTTLSGFLVLAAGLPLAAELLFRGLIHGMWTEELPAQRRGGRWFISWPAIGSALLYSAATLSTFVPLSDVRTWIWPPEYLLDGTWAILTALLGSLIFGLATAMARERSESVFVPLVFHWLCILGIILLA